MKISIGIPAYNAGPFLARTVESAWAQTITDWEMVIVNDGSRDDTLAVARACMQQDPRIRVIDKVNEGVSKARTCAFEAMDPRAGCVIFLDSDDVWEPDTLATLCAALEAHPNAVAAHGDARLIDREGRCVNPGALESWCREPRCVVSKYLEAVPEGITTFTVLAYRCCIATTGAVLIRREALESECVWDTAATPCEDWDMWLRLSARGDFAYTDRVVLNYRRHGDNASDNRGRMKQSDYYVRRKVLTRPGYTDEQRTTMRRAFRLLKQQTFRDKIASFQQGLRRGRLSDASIDIVAALRCYFASVRGIPRA